MAQGKGSRSHPWILQWRRKGGGGGGGGGGVLSPPKNGIGGAELLL